MKTRDLALVAVFTSLSAAMRIVKNTVITLQFINIPLAFAFTAAALYGAKVGFLVGFLSYVISDVLIFPGVWTLVNAPLAGLTAWLYGALQGHSESRVHRFVLTFMLVFLFDILSSGLLYIAFGVGPIEALLTGLIGLFLPVMGGYMVGVGPLTEATTSALTVLLIEGLHRRKI